MHTLFLRILRADSKFSFTVTLFIGVTGKLFIVQLFGNFFIKHTSLKAIVLLRIRLCRCVQMSHFWWIFNKGALCPLVQHSEIHFTAIDDVCKFVSEKSSGKLIQRQKQFYNLIMDYMRYVEVFGIVCFGFYDFCLYYSFGSSEFPWLCKLIKIHIFNASQSWWSWQMKGVCFKGRVKVGEVLGSASI